MRHLKLLLIIIIVFGSAASGHAQLDYVLDLNGPGLPPNHNTCASLKVVDMRKDKTSIGSISKRKFNKLITAAPLDQSLELLYPNLKAGNKGSEDELILVLYEFMIKDKLDNDESGIFLFSGDFFRGSGGKYRLVASVDSLYETRAPVDVTTRLLLGSTKQLNLILSYYAMQLPPKANTTLYSMEELQDRRNSEKLAYPIYKRVVFKKGIYYTAEQFLNNTPVDTPLIRKTYIREGGLKMHYFYYANEKGRKGEKIDEYMFFAVYDGEDWWTPNVNYCTIMRYVDNEFYAQQFFKQMISGTYGSAAEAGGMFGLVGGLIAGAVDASHSGKHVDWVLYKARFNPLSKHFVPVDRPNAK